MIRQQIQPVTALRAVCKLAKSNNKSHVRGRMIFAIVIESRNTGLTVSEKTNCMEETKQQNNANYLSAARSQPHNSFWKCSNFVFVVLYKQSKNSVSFLKISCILYFFIHRFAFWRRCSFQLTHNLVVYLHQYLVVL